MTHPDDRFRNNDCPRCKRLEQEVAELRALAQMYREQIKDYQQRESADDWYMRRGSGVLS